MFLFLAGAVDEEIFVKTFTDVPTVQIYSQKELGEQIKNISEIISDPNKDWNKRTDAVSNFIIFLNTLQIDYYIIR